MSDSHEWCRDVRRDEAVRAAEDAAAVPAIQHRDLPEVVAELRERVARLEAAEKQAASTEAMRCMTKMRRERDEARAECERLRIAQVKAAQERDRANEARGRIRSEWTRRGQSLHAAQQTIGALNARVAELEAAAPPRGWLTEEERDAVDFARAYYHAQTCGMDEAGAWHKLHRRRQLACEALLARSTPRVKVPHLDDLEADERPVWQSACEAWIAAIRAAGGEVE